MMHIPATAEVKNTEKEIVFNPHYAGKKENILVLAAYTEDLCNYVFRITNNEKQFGKTYRNNLVSDLRNSCLALLQLSYRISIMRPNFIEDYRKRLKLERKFSEIFMDLRCLIYFSTTVANINNIEYLGVLLDKVNAALAAVIKRDKRKIKNAKHDPYFVDTEDYVEIPTSDDKLKELNMRTFTIDDDGFTVIKFKRDVVGVTKTKK